MGDKLSGVNVGDVLKIYFPAHKPEGHEQEGTRPAIVVGVPDTLGKPRFPVLVVVPLTSQLEEWAKNSPTLYPVLEVGAGGVDVPSVALTDQVRAVGVSRITGRYGTLTSVQLGPVKDALFKLLEMSRPPAKVTMRR